MQMRMSVFLRACLLSLVLAVVALAADQGTTTAQPLRTSQSCTKHMTTKRKFEPSKLPGFGWDNLRNLPLKQVVNLTYSMCTSITNFVVPDEVVVLPVLFSEQLPKVEVFGNSAQSKVTSLFSRTINLQASLSVPFDTISGTLSQELSEIRKQQYSTASPLFRSHVRLSRYELGLQSGLQLTAAFKEAVLDIANSVQLNFHGLARHQALTLVRNFGTHLTTRTVLGAILLKTDVVTLRFFESKSFESLMKISSSAFQSKFGMLRATASLFGTSPVESSNSKGYREETISTNKSFSGGIRPPEGIENLLKVWVESIEANMAVIDRDGDPLYHLIRPLAFPDVPANLISTVSDMVRAAIVLYYELNTIPGCLDEKRRQYSPFANFPDSSCGGTLLYGERLGGVYQTCQVVSGSGGADLCKDREINNSYTSDMNCPKKYTARQLFKGTYSRVDEQPCKSCEPTFNRSEVVYTTYWCQSEQATGQRRPAPGTKEIGYLFGGFFTSVSDNRVIQEKSCPSKYSPRRILDDLFICEGNVFSPDLGFTRLPFQGFMSCQNDSIPRYRLNKGFCDPNFSKILATSVQGCNVYICSRLTVELPPTPRIPIGELARPSLPVYVSSYDGNLIFNIRNKTWAKIEKERFGVAEPRLSYRDTAILAFLSGFAAIVICVVIFLIICWCWKRKQPPPRTITPSQESNVEKKPSKVTSTKPSMLEFDEDKI